MQDKKYQIIIRMPIKAVDDIDARIKAQDIIRDVDLGGAEFKLQEVIENGPPRGVQITLAD
jgi:hypothetical protein